MSEGDAQKDRLAPTRKLSSLGKAFLLSPDSRGIEGIGIGMKTERQHHHSLQQEEKLSSVHQQQPIHDVTQNHLFPPGSARSRISAELLPRSNVVGDMFVPSSGSATGSGTQLNPCALPFPEFVSSSGHGSAPVSGTQLNPCASPFAPSKVSLSKTRRKKTEAKKTGVDLLLSRAKQENQIQAWSTNTTLNPCALPFTPSNASASNGWSNKTRVNHHLNRAQQEERIRRTIYVSCIHSEVTEEHLAGLFQSTGKIVDCRIWGHSTPPFRFGFLEFTNTEGADKALRFARMLAQSSQTSSMCFSPSRTAIIPINPAFLPRSEAERERCAHTIYCKNIDKKLSQADVRLFFESSCGEIIHFRLLCDSHHATNIAFVEFMTAESAKIALNKSGEIFGTLPIRVCPSKTPVRLGCKDL